MQMQMSGVVFHLLKNLSKPYCTIKVQIPLDCHLMSAVVVWSRSPICAGFSRIFESSVCEVGIRFGVAHCWQDDHEMVLCDKKNGQYARAESSPVTYRFNSGSLYLLNPIVKPNPKRWRMKWGY